MSRSRTDAASRSGRTGQAGRSGRTDTAGYADRSRTFPPLPARAGARGLFAESWWGSAWLDALEAAALDPARLARGRTYARDGNVGTITITPGRITAVVHGSRPRPYSTGIRLRTLADQEWDALLDAVAAEPAQLAALLGRKLPRALAEAGVGLLPGPGDLAPHCSCPDRGHPCKHAAALCFQVARLLDADPFVLFLMRGRGERELLDELSRRNTALAAEETRAPSTRAPGPPRPRVTSGLSARAALADRPLPPLPPPFSLPATPGHPPSLPESDGLPVDSTSVAFLAADAVTRAHAYLTAVHPPSRPDTAPRAQAPDKDALTAAERPASERPASERPASERPASERPASDRPVPDRPALDQTTPAPTAPAPSTPAPVTPDPAFSPAAEALFPVLDLWQDAIRLAAGAHPTAGLTSTTRALYRDIAEATGRSAAEVARAVAAWRQGGSEGLGVLEVTWNPPAGDFDRARGALTAAGLPLLRPRHNHLTAPDGGVQLRFGHDGRWYPYESDPGRDDWWPAGAADPDPVVALTTLTARLAQ